MRSTVLAALLVVAVVSAAERPRALDGTDSWVNFTGSLARKLSECGTLTLLVAVPNSDSIIAGVAGRGLWINESGTTWTRLGDGAGSERIWNRPTSIVFDPVTPNTFWESGIYNGPGVFKTTDGGKTFHHLGDVRHNDMMSVDLSDPQRQTLLAGGHESAQTLYLSTDGGQTWRNVGGNIPAEKEASTTPVALNARTFLINASGNPSRYVGVYRTVNGGDTWQQVSALSPTGLPLVTANGTIFWPAAGGLLRSTDAGLSWARVGANLLPVRPAELPEGKLAAVGENTLMVSSDGGATWTPVGGQLPYHPDGLIYSPPRKAFFMWRGVCKDEVQIDAVMMLNYDASSAASRTP